MWSSDRPATCSECGHELRALEDLGGFCLICSRTFCREHLVIRNGVPNCRGCEAARQQRENEGPISQVAVARLLRLLGRDLVETIGAGHEPMIEEAAARIRLFCDDPDDFEQRVVHDVQQSIQCDFIDTSWPHCPDHPKHPLGYSGGWWSCGQSRRRVAPLGELRGHK